MTSQGPQLLLLLHWGLSFNINTGGKTITQTIALGDYKGVGPLIQGQYKGSLCIEHSMDQKLCLYKHTISHLSIKKNVCAKYYDSNFEDMEMDVPKLAQVGNGGAKILTQISLTPNPICALITLLLSLST